MNGLIDRYDKMEIDSSVNRLMEVTRKKKRSRLSRLRWIDR